MERGFNRPRAREEPYECSHHKLSKAAARSHQNDLQVKKNGKKNPLRKIICLFLFSRLILLAADWLLDLVVLPMLVWTLVQRHVLRRRSPSLCPPRLKAPAGCPPRVSAIVHIEVDSTAVADFEADVFRDFKGEVFREGGVRRCTTPAS